MVSDRLLRPDQWSNRDFPVLLAVAEALEKSPGFGVQADELIVDGVESSDVTPSVIRLIETDFLDGNVQRAFGGNAWVNVNTLTERGLRATGIWPADDRAVETLVAALDAAAEREVDAGKKGKIQAAARAVGGVVGTAAGETLGAFVRAQLGIPS